ncbi:MAG: alpha/beta hydrolase, partial [Clostridiales bacterium]|nr:alpha/beta hydrolase [Clostridiales bacterium]
NICYINEANNVLQNARTVSNSDYVSCPMIMFSSNGKQIDKYWIENQQKFAEIMNAKLIRYDCGHYIHYYKSVEMANEINKFINSF